MKPTKTANSQYHKALEHALELSGAQEVFFAEYQAHIIAQLLKEQSYNPATVLDYGCGDGTMTYLLNQLLPEAQIQGIDTSQELIEIAQEWYEIEHKLSFSTQLEKRYDLIYLANVLHHIPNNERALLFKKLTTHLTPHGLLIVLEFNPLNPLAVWQFYRNKEERGNHMIMPRSLKKLLAQFGKITIYYYKKVFATILQKD